MGVVDVNYMIYLYSCFLFYPASSLKRFLSPIPCSLIRIGSAQVYRIGYVYTAASGRDDVYRSAGSEYRILFVLYSESADIFTIALMRVAKTVVFESDSTYETKQYNMLKSKNFE